MDNEDQCAYCRKMSTDTIDGIPVCRKVVCRTLGQNERADAWVFVHRYDLERQFGKYTGGEKQILNSAREDVIAARKIVGTLGDMTIR